MIPLLQVHTSVSVFGNLSSNCCVGKMRKELTIWRVSFIRMQFSIISEYILVNCGPGGSSANTTPSTINKCSVILRLLTGNNTISERLRILGSSRFCQTCNMMAPDTIHHMLFQCPTIVTGTDTGWKKVLDQAPMALANELVAMNDNNRAIFILSGMRGYIWEWNITFINIVHYLAAEGVARYCCSVHPCVHVRPIFWYFISRLLEEILIWNLYRILIGLYSIHRKILTFIGQSHRDGTLLFEGTVISQKLSHRIISIIFHRHLLGYSIRWNNKNEKWRHKKYVNIWL